MEKKKTAVEFLEETFLKRMQEHNFVSKYDLLLFKRAKEMEKNQKIEDFDKGVAAEYKRNMMVSNIMNVKNKESYIEKIGLIITNGEQYYEDVYEK